MLLEKGNVALSMASPVMAGLQAMTPTRGPAKSEPSAFSMSGVLTSPRGSPHQAAQASPQAVQAVQASMSPQAAQAAVLRSRLLAAGAGVLQSTEQRQQQQQQVASVGRPSSSGLGAGSGQTEELWQWLENLVIEAQGGDSSSLQVRSTDGVPARVKEGAPCSRMVAGLMVRVMR